jgi:prepilin-type processing-associated H-X9-DG protein
MSMYMNWQPDPESSGYSTCWHRGSQIQNPGPSRAAVFIDEHEKSIQQSAFGINAPDSFTLFGSSLWTWVSFPATRHGGAGTLSFADGHAELWRWIEANTLRIAALNDWIVMKPAVPNTDRDLGRFFKVIPEKSPDPIISPATAQGAQIHSIFCISPPVGRRSRPFQCGATECQAWNERVYLATIVRLRLRRAEAACWDKAQASLRTPKRFAIDRAHGRRASVWSAAARLPLCYWVLRNAQRTTFNVQRTTCNAQRAKG